MSKYLDTWQMKQRDGEGNDDMMQMLNAYHVQVVCMYVVVKVVRKCH